MRATFRLVLLAGIIGGLAFAKDTASQFKYLSKDQETALVDSVPPPPAPGSAEDQADLTAILAAEKTRTPEVVAECKLDEGFSYKLFQPVYGLDLTEENSPKFHQMISDVLHVSGFVFSTAKAKYKRLRPYEGHPDTVKSIFPANGYSYPSGHATASFLLAEVLGTIFPDKAQALLDRAGQIAQSRVNAAVHYPSDIKEGETVGKAAAAELLADPAFQKDLANVKAELKKEFPQLSTESISPR